MSTHKRNADAVVISDVHLGTFGSRATELHRYLKSIDTPLLILNGDIIDGWQFRKSFWPKSHTKVLRRILKMMMVGTQVYYITGNHDEMLRRYAPLTFGNLTLCNQVTMDINNEKYWFVHGDAFDMSITHAKWLAKLGGKSYDLLIAINTFVNFILHKMGRNKVSFSARVKNSVKVAVKYITSFEEVIAETAAHEGCQYVVCGHIHQPVIREAVTEKGSVTYMNSGDWIENLSALELVDGKWQLYKYNDAHFVNAPADAEDEVTNITLSPEMLLNLPKTF
jgi:UDP-2,3-diacylglucosamine pyrophosphatase LpxH